VILKSSKHHNIEANNFLQLFFALCALLDGENKRNQANLTYFSE